MDTSFFSKECETPNRWPAAFCRAPQTWREQCQRLCNAFCGYKQRTLCFKRVWFGRWSFFVRDCLMLPEFWRLWPLSGVGTAKRFSALSNQNTTIPNTPKGKVAFLRTKMHLDWKRSSERPSHPSTHSCTREGFQAESPRTARCSAFFVNLLMYILAFLHQNSCNCHQNGQNNWAADFKTRATSEEMMMMPAAPQETTRPLGRNWVRHMFPGSTESCLVAEPVESCEKMDLYVCMYAGMYIDRMIFE